MQEHLQKFRIFEIDATETVRHFQEINKSTQVVSTIAGQLVMSAAMMSYMKKNNKLTISLDSKSELGKVISSTLANFEQTERKIAKVYADISSFSFLHLFNRTFIL